MQLNLQTPLVFFDLETTGLDLSKDRIVEIAYTKVMPNGREESKTIRINPEMHISAEATAVTGIHDEDVANCPTFKQVAAEIARDFEGCDLAGYNSNHFDIPMLGEEMLRAGIDIDLMKRRHIDVQNIFHRKEQRTLSAAYRFYCGRELTDAHSANADTMATYEVLKAQLDRYPDLKNDVGYLADYSTISQNVDYAGRFVWNKNKQEVINFGKYKGQVLADVLKRDPGYYGWMMQGDFPLHTKKILTAVYIRVKTGKSAS
ncbi:MAG: ribonuclease H-like domain-containing protein [Paludibacteraceae bacterium]|nr:ribonuclease H-like domain-containing protein [Paludibacteraceae bacterium]